MSSLPQRKKSAEEIAKLRESFGVPGSPLPESPPDDSPAPASEEVDTLVATNHEATVVHESPELPEIAEPLPLPPTFAPHENHSLKHSEHIPEPVPEPAREANLPAKSPKQVRSLRRSEREPLAAPSPNSSVPDTKLPSHRHSDREIGELRRREMLAMTATPPPNPKFQGAHLGIVIPGYLLAAGVWLPLADTLYQSLSAGAGWSFLGEPGYPIAVPAACAVIAILIAAFVFLKRPISRHHAAFITMITVFALVFEALHYFPQLRHAT